MRTIFKWLLRGLFLVIAAVGIGAAFVFAALYSTVPSASGRAAVPGLSAEARIVREGNGIVHVEAASHADAARALGYAHAQDRFWQMHVLRRVAEGRLSELFGSATVNTDIFLRTVDMAGSAKASYDNLDADTKAVLQAYAQGVNSWLSRDVSLLSTRLPPEFLILGKEAEPWEAWQSVAIIKVMALTLDSNMDSEIRRLALAARGFASREIDDLLPYSPRDNPPPLPDLRLLYGFGPEGKPGANAGPGGTSRYAEGLAWPVGVTASNNWAVAGSRTETGKPLLANDPHLGLTTPTIFYLAHLSFEEGGRKKDVVGASLPGTPLILAGRTSGVAWGLTTTNLDSQDLFIERVKPDDPKLYYRTDGWKPFDTQDITIAVSGGEPVTYVRRSTDKGPVLPDTYRSLPQILPAGHVAALSWVSLATDDTTVAAALALNRAETVADAMAATRLMVAPMQSIVIADTAGNIALVAPGRVPMRSPMNLVNGRAPVPGWLPEYGWTGFMPQELLPRIDNPAAGALATANGDWLPDDYAGHITHDFDEQFRQARAEQLIIGANAAHSLATMKAAQADDYSPAVDDFRREALAQLAGGSGQDAELMTALKAWDGQMEMDRPEPLIVTAWWRHAHEALFSDDLGEDYARFASGRLEPVLTALTSAGGRDWCDNRETAQSETCGILLAQSLSKALDELKSLQGPDWKAWRWGTAHPAWGEHRPFSSVAPLAPIFTVDRPSAGDSYTLLRGKTDFSEKEPYRNVHASAYRAIYDLSDMDASLFITSTGQSGHFLSPHYDDFADKWSAAEYITMTTNPDDYRTRAAGIFVLEPAAD